MAAIEEVFDADQPVQRCRNHKMRNALDELPKEEQAQALRCLQETLRGLGRGPLAAGQAIGGLLAHWRKKVRAAAFFSVSLQNRVF